MNTSSCLGDTFQENIPLLWNIELIVLLAGWVVTRLSAQFRWPQPQPNLLAGFAIMTIDMKCLLLEYR